MNATHLTGLEGVNPLGFFAALGVQVAFSSEPEQPRLWWSEGITPYALVDSIYSHERIADQAMKVFPQWRDSPAINPRQDDGKPMKWGDELKLSPRDIRTYLRQSGHGQQPASGLATALVAEGSLSDTKKKDDDGKEQPTAKPTDLYFAAGQQKFLDAVRKILSKASHEDLLAGLRGPWCYGSKLPSLGWDITDDRLYALRANNPSTDKKTTNPGPEALAVLGLSLHPVFKGRDRIITQGCSGSWKSASYAWPLWSTPASSNAVKSLLAQAYSIEGRNQWLHSWGVFRILISSIRRSGQGGYGTFGPPEVLWQT